METNTGTNHPAYIKVKSKAKKRVDTANIGSGALSNYETGLPVIWYERRIQ